jgi:hypothetical protein
VAVAQGSTDNLLMLSSQYSLAAFRHGTPLNKPIHGYVINVTDVTIFLPKLNLYLFWSAALCFQFVMYDLSSIRHVPLAVLLRL